MDEGFNTFINSVADKDFNKGEFYQKTRYRERAARFFQPNSESIMTSPEVTNPRYLSVNAYEKPGMGLELLRYDILGEARFDSAFCYYIRSWAFKHPDALGFLSCHGKWQRRRPELVLERLVFEQLENRSGCNSMWSIYRPIRPMAR